MCCWASAFFILIITFSFFEPVRHFFGLNGQTPLFRPFKVTGLMNLKWLGRCTFATAPTAPMLVAWPVTCFSVDVRIFGPELADQIIASFQMSRWLPRAVVFKPRPPISLWRPLHFEPTIIWVSPDVHDFGYFVFAATLVHTPLRHPAMFNVCHPHFRWKPFPAVPATKR